MYLAKRFDLKIEIADTLEEMMEKLSLREYTDIEETEEKYVYYNGEILTEEEREERIKIEVKSKLKMTKRDFFLYILKPYNVTYSALMEVLKSNDTLLACYEGCNHIYRYDEMLVGNIGPILKQLTGTDINEDELSAFLDTQFELHNALD